MPRGLPRTDNAKLANTAENMDTVRMRTDPALMTNQAIGLRIELLHNALGMNQSTFASATGVRQTTLSNYKKGTNRLSLDEAFKIVTFARVTLDWLYFGDPSGMPMDLWQRISEQRQKDSAA